MSETDDYWKPYDMSETTLDQIRHWRDRAVQGVVTPLTTVQIIRLCDAAERAEALEVEVAKWNKCDSLVCPYEQRALTAEASLAPLRAVLKVQREMPWFNTNSETYRVNAAKFLVAQQVLNAVPADPSAPTPSDSVTRAQAEQRLTDDFLDGISINADSPSLIRGALLDWLFGPPAPTPR